MILSSLERKTMGDEASVINSDTSFLITVARFLANKD